MTLYFETGDQFTCSIHDVETCTHESWHSLISQANQAHVPYFGVGICTFTDGSRKAYDAFYLDRCLKAQLISNVASISYQFLKLPAQLNQMTFSFKSLQLPKSYEHRTIAFEANNFHACRNDDAQKERAANCQFVFGHYLKKTASDDAALIEAVRWLHLASINGCKLADIELHNLDDNSL